MSSSSIPGLALLVIDAQEVFRKALPNFDTFLQRCRFAIRAADLLDLPVVFTEQVPEKLGPTAAELTEGRERHIFPKTAFSALGAEGLETYLKDHDIHHLLIAGLETPVCVYQTVLEALAKDFETTLLVDALDARRASDAEWVLRSLADQDVHVLPAETVFYAILGDTTHPQFSAFNKLVKES